MPSALLALVTTVAFQGWGSPALNPATYTSPSGRFSLWVNPTSPEGSGPADYRLSENGRLKWSKRLPFTWSAAAVGEGGQTAGFGYDGQRPREGVFIVAILSPNGEVLRQERHPRKPSRFLHTEADPKAADILIDDAGDRVIVRVVDPDVNRRREDWWIYGRSDGQPRPALHPGATMEESIRGIVKAKSLPGLPLTLVNWWHFDNKMGAEFTLVDPAGKNVWREQRHGDYEIKGSDAAQDYLRTKMQQEGAVHSVGPGARFTLHFVKDNQLVSFAVKSHRSGWMVDEVARTPAPVVLHTPGTSGISTSPVPIIRLRPTRKWEIPVARPKKTAVSDVYDFHWTGPNRLTYLRGRPVPAIVTVDGKGRLIGEARLPVSGPKDYEKLSFAWCGANRFVAFLSQGGKAKAWRVDTSTRRVHPLAAFQSATVDAAAGFPDGSFTTLTTEWARYTSVQSIAVHDAAGRLKWRRGDGGGYGGRPDDLLSPEDVAIDRQGRVIVLDVIRKSLQTFTRDGRFVGRTPLTPEPQYATQLSIDPQGQPVILDFGGERPLIRQGWNGRRTSAIAPHYPGGKRLVLHEDFRFDSAGRMWATDGPAIYRFDAGGQINRHLGEIPSPAGLKSVAQLHVAFDGTVTALDATSAEISVFRADGALGHVSRPLPKDFAARPPEFSRMDVTRSGDVYLWGGTGDGLLKFAASGKRLGYVPWSAGSASPLAKKVQPDWRWNESRLVDAHGKVVATLNRWPNLDWMLDGPTADAPDGGLLAVEDNDFGRPKAKIRIAWFSPTGQPLAMANLPPSLSSSHSVAYDGHLAYLVTSQYLVAVDRKGKAAWRYPLPGKDRSWSVFASRGGIALFDGERTVTWYDAAGHPAR